MITCLAAGDDELSRRPSGAWPTQRALRGRMTPRRDGSCCAERGRPSPPPRTTGLKATKAIVLRKKLHGGSRELSIPNRNVDSPCGSFAKKRVERSGAGRPMWRYS